MRRQKSLSRTSLLCLVDESGSLLSTDSEPYRIGFLITGRRDRLESDIRRLKRELPPHGKAGEFHAREDHPCTRAMIRRLLCLNNEPRMHIVEWIKEDFSAEYFVNGKLKVFSNTSVSIGSFALTATEIAAAASANGHTVIDLIAEAAKVDIHSEHRSRTQAFGPVLQVALEKQAIIKRAPPGTRTLIRVSTKRKSQYAPLSFVDYWLWAYCRHADRDEAEVFPDELRLRTTVRRMTEKGVNPSCPGDEQ